MLAIVMTLQTVLVGCVDSSRESDSVGESLVESGGADGQEFDVTGLLGNLAENVFIPNYQELSETMSEFGGVGGSLERYCSRIGESGEAASRAEAQDDWRAAMDSLQKTEMHVLGPAQRNGNALRNRILSYANGSLSTCGVDEIAVLANEPEFDISTRATNQRGMGAVGYLLFRDELSHSCPPQVPTTASWNALSETAKSRSRCVAAQVIASDVSAAVDQIVDQWDAAGGDYRSEFVSDANAGNNLQLVTDAIFYLDTGVKDQKLGIPLGINDACSGYSCPDQVESQYSRNSLRNLQKNIESFRKIFRGGEGIGFDDLITGEGFDDVSLRFIDNSKAAIEAIDAISVPVYEQAASINSQERGTQCTNAYANVDLADELSACGLYGLIKALTDDLKIDFVTIVNVNLPEGAQADND